jgi:hypothetical protein
VLKSAGSRTRSDEYHGAAPDAVRVALATRTARMSAERQDTRDPERTMQVIYLDRNHWIGLSRVAHGREGSADRGHLV